MVLVLPLTEYIKAEALIENDGAFQNYYLFYAVRLSKGTCGANMLAQNHHDRLLTAHFQ